MVLFDTSVLVFAFDSKANAPLDPTTNAPLTHAKERVDGLIASLSANKVRIMIPTPVLTEYLVGAGKDKQARFGVFSTSPAFVVVPFDQRAAVECAMLNDPDLHANKPLDQVQTKAKVRFDRQIIAIALVQRATCIYTGDNGVAHIAKASGMTVIAPWELPIPSTQLSLLPDEDKT